MLNGNQAPDYYAAQVVIMNNISSILYYHILRDNSCRSIYYLTGHMVQLIGCT